MRLSVLFFLLLAFDPAQAQGPQITNDRNCPTAQSAGQGYIVERGERSKTEIFHVEGGSVRSVLRVGGNTLLETTQFQGLLETDRIDRGRRTVSRPLVDLATFFPLKVGQEFTAKFELGEGVEKTKKLIRLSIKAADVLYIGPCKYDILKIDRSEGRDESSLRFLSTDYFSPGLKIVLAKERDEANGTKSLIKFDKIYSTSR